MRSLLTSSEQLLCKGKDVRGQQWKRMGASRASCVQPKYCPAIFT